MDGGVDVSRLIPGEKLDEATRKRIRDLIRAVAGDVSHVGSQLAGERVKVLAPEGVVTVELIAFVDRVLGMAVPRCARCLDISIGLCNPCRPEHAAELAAAVRGEAPASVEHMREPVLDEGVVATNDPSQVDPERACYGKHRYGDAKEARKVANRCEAERGVPLRVYPCTACGGFHLTRQRPIGRRA